jgi:predicted transcriptional regulator
MEGRSPPTEQPVRGSYKVFDEELPILGDWTRQVAEVLAARPSAFLSELQQIAQWDPAQFRMVLREMRKLGLVETQKLSSNAASVWLLSPLGYTELEKSRVYRAQRAKNWARRHGATEVPE